jgi:Fe-S cluster assembly protein SufB
MSEVDTIDIDYSKYDFKDPEKAVFRTQKGLSEEIVRQISQVKGEPKWMTDFRVRAYKHFVKRPLPEWGADLSTLDFDETVYYLRPTDKDSRSWDDVPDNIKKTFDRLGIPEAERKFLGGVGAQYDSEVVYHNIHNELEKQGVVFESMDAGLVKYPEIVKKHFGTVIPPEDNKFAALNSAVWSGGSFVYVPAGVEVSLPLQAYFRINAANMGQFERTLIIAEPNSKIHYIEGCTAPVYSKDALHAAVVEVIAKPGSKVRYTTIQNWSSDVYNLVTKRAHAHKDATVEWVDGNIGSKITMKYPSVYLMGPGARAEVLSVAYAGKDKHLDAGAKAVHLAPDTASTITSKSISKDGGRTTYRGLVKVMKGAERVKSSVRCDALLLDEISRTDTYPYIEIDEDNVDFAHEATVGKIGEEQIFYLMSRGLSESEAYSMVVKGFIEEFAKELPMEYAVELNRLIELEMVGAIG